MVRCVASDCPRWRPHTSRSLPALLLDKEPTNMQAHSLGVLIDNGVKRGPYTFTLSNMLLIIPSCHNRRTLR